MAKRIEIAESDSGPWLTFPGSEGNLDTEAAEVPDTIFGQTFQSNDTGLTTWTIGGNSVYKGFPGFKVKLRKAGTPTGFTGEEMNQDSNEPERFRIDDSSKNLWDRETPVTVYDDSNDVTADVEQINYLFGEVVFASGSVPSGVVTVDGASRSQEPLGRADSYTLTMQTEATPDSDFDSVQDNGFFTMANPGLRTVSLEISGTWTKSASVRTQINSGEEVIIEINPDGEGYSVARGFFRAASEGQSGPVGQREEASINFVLNVPEHVEFPFAWRHASNSPLPAAVKMALEHWQNEEQPWLRYSPPSVAGSDSQRWGSAVLTDVSLEGGLEEMNTFTLAAQGDGRLFEVT